MTGYKIADLRRVVLDSHLSPLTAEEREELSQIKDDQAFYRRYCMIIGIEPMPGKAKAQASEVRHIPVTDTEQPAAPQTEAPAPSEPEVPQPQPAPEKAA